MKRFIAMADHATPFSLALLAGANLIFFVGALGVALRAASLMH